MYFNNDFLNRGLYPLKAHTRLMQVVGEENAIIPCLQNSFDGLGIILIKAYILIRVIGYFYFWRGSRPLLKGTPISNFSFYRCYRVVS